MSISLNNSFYVDCNRKLSNSSEELPSEWEYHLNNGIKLPIGTTIQVTNSFLNYQGITGGSMEFLEDKEEEVCYGFYVTQGSQFITLDRRITDTNAGIEGTSKDDNTTGTMLYDSLHHRNIQNSSKSPLLRITKGENTKIPDDITTETNFIKGEINTFKYGTQSHSTAIPDISLHYQKQFEYYQDDAFTITQVGLYYKNPNLNNILANLIVAYGGEGYTDGWLPWVANGGLGGPVGANYINAKGMYFVENGIIQKIYISNVGKGYTSDPTVINFYNNNTPPTIVTPTQTSLIEINRGILASTRTNGSGRFMVVTLYNGNDGNDIIGRIMASGFGYKKGDEVYLDDGIAEGFTDNLFPINHNAPITECIITLTHSTSYTDIPSPGIIKAFYNNSDDFEQIYYNNVGTIPSPGDIDTNLTYEPTLFFTMNENENLRNDNYGNNLFYQPQDSLAVANKNDNPDINPRNLSYIIEMKKYIADTQTPAQALTKGADYTYLPEISYTPSAYVENNLNEEGYWNPKFRAVMNNLNEVEKVVYIPGAYNDISSGNISTEAAVRNTNKTQNESGVPPGYLGVIGGNPTTRAFCRFTATESRLTVPEKTGTTDFYGKAQPLIRMFNQSGGLKLGGTSLVILDLSNAEVAWPGATEYNLIQKNENFTGINGKVQINSVGHGNTPPDIPLSLNVSQTGTDYKIGDVYIIENLNVEVMVIDLELPGTHANNNEDNTDPQFFTVNEINNGIMEVNNNILTSNSYLRGKSSQLAGDVYMSDSGTAIDSVNPKYQYNNSYSLGFPNLRATGGTEDPIGLCEFDEFGILKPVVKKKKITIPKGIYGIQDIEDLITEVFTGDNEESGFINNSSFTQKIQFHDYEPAQFTGELNYRANRYIFVGMEDYNNLSNLWATNNQLQLLTQFKWENFRLSNYYAFPKSYFPKPKKPFQICADFKFKTSAHIQSLVSTSLIKFDTESTFSQTNTNLIIGTSDFNFQYDDKKATFAINYLHQPIRNPVYDKFANEFSQPGQIGVFIRKLANASNIYGIGKQYLHLNGRNSETPEHILKQLEKPIIRAGGIMIHNFSLNRALKGPKATNFVNPEYAKFSDFFNSIQEASQAWQNSIWRRTGFSYLQLNENFEDVSYYKNTSVKLYGVTTRSSLDTSQIPTISSEYNALVNTGSKSDNQQVFNNSNPSNASVPVYVEGTYSSVSGDGGSTNQTNQILDLYQGGLYDASQCFFVQVAGKELLGESLPQLQINGYFIVTSDIIDGYRDSVKRNENIPLLAVIPKISYQSQDFINSYSEITHVLSNPKVINKIKIKVYNPDLTNPILGEDSSIMLKITLPPQLPPQIQKPDADGEKKKSIMERRKIKKKAEGKQ